MSQKILDFSVSDFPICQLFRTSPQLATTDEMLLISGDMSGIQGIALFFSAKNLFAISHNSKPFTHDR